MSMRQLPYGGEVGGAGRGQVREVVGSRINNRTTMILPPIHVLSPKLLLLQLPMLIFPSPPRPVLEHTTAAAGIYGLNFDLIKRMDPATIRPLLRIWFGQGREEGCTFSIE